MVTVAAAGAMVVAAVAVNNRLNAEDHCCNHKCRLSTLIRADNVL